MEVGIEDCLHIEFEYDKAAYALKDVVVGKIYFLLVSPRTACSFLVCSCSSKKQDGKSDAKRDSSGYGYPLCWTSDTST